MPLTRVLGIWGLSCHRVISNLLPTYNQNIIPMRTSPSSIKNFNSNPKRNYVFNASMHATCQKTNMVLTSIFAAPPWGGPWWTLAGMLPPSGSEWLDDIRARVRSIKATRSEWVFRRWDICRMWLQYCGHSINRSTNCSNALVPNTNICMQPGTSAQI